MTVSVPFSAQPNQVLDAFRRIQEEARKTGRELKNLGDVNFPGLEDAKRTLESVNVGLQQMMSPAVRTRAAESLRAGVKAGMYSPDIVSVLSNTQRQFPDQHALQNHLNALVQQSSNIAAMDSVTHPVSGASGSGGMFGGVLPMMKGMLPFMGVGAGLAFAGKKIGDATEEAIEMSALRRSVGATNIEFEEFRDHIRKAGEGMALNSREQTGMARAYAQMSGAVGADAVGHGANLGMRMARERGMDPSIGVGMMGRATWLGLGKNEDASFKKLAEIMAGSGLGRRQADAADAMLRFAERSNQFQVDGGNTAGFREKYLALVTSGHAGLLGNAESIIGGFDSAVRQGGMAGDAGKNLMWNVFAQHGVNNPFQMQRYQQMGFTGLLPDGSMIGDVLSKHIKGMGGDKDMQSSRLSGFFGGSMDVTSKALEAMAKYQSDPAKMAAEIKRIEDEHRKSDPGYRAAETAADLERELTKASLCQIRRPHHG